MEYAIIEREDRAELVRVVNVWIQKGYIPQGGVSCTVVLEDCWVDDYNRCRSTRLLFHQAMIKSNDKSHRAEKAGKEA